MDGVLKGLVDSVRAAPDDDAPRWVVADWFESAGQTDRARLMRLQLEAARLPTWDAGRAIRAVEERVLVGRHGADLHGLPAFDGVVWGRFHRGFVDRAAFDSAKALATHGAACADATLLSAVAFRWPRLADRIELPRIEGVTEVTVTGTLMDPADIAWLMACPLMSTVKRLNLVGSQMEAAALQQLLASPITAQLEALRLPMHNFGADGAQILFRADLPKLVELDVSVASLDDLGSGGRWQPTMGAEAAAALASWPALARLRHLDLTGNQITEEGLSALVSSPNTSALRSLRIRSIADWDWEEGDGRPDLLMALAVAAPTLQLDEIDLSECDLTDASLPAVRECSALRELKVLRFSYGQSLNRLVGAPWWSSLRVLEADNIGDSGIAAVLGSEAPHLHTLRMRSTYAWSQPKSVGKLFTAAKPLPALVHLDLAGLGVDDRDLTAIGGVTTLPALLALDLASDADEDDAEYSEETVEAFAASPLGARLHSLTTGYEDLDRSPAPAPIELYEAYDYRGALRFL